MNKLEKLLQTDEPNKVIQSIGEISDINDLIHCLKSNDQQVLKNAVFIASQIRHKFKGFLKYFRPFLSNIDLVILSDVLDIILVSGSNEDGETILDCFQLLFDDDVKTQWLGLNFASRVPVDFYQFALAYLHKDTDHFNALDEGLLFLIENKKPNLEKEWVYANEPYKVLFGVISSARNKNIELLTSKDLPSNLRAFCKDWIYMKNLIADT